MNFKCIIFDFDGTLADTNTGIVRTYQKTLETLGIPVPSVERISSTIGLPLRECFTAGVDGITDEQADEAVVTYRRLFDGIAIPATTAFPGIVDTLRTLYENGYRLAIATSRSHRSLGILSEKIGVAGFFEGMYGVEDVVNHKPAPDMVNLILKDFGIAPEDALVVGDATYDLLMGHGAGCKVCGVTWGNQGREMLSGVDPEYIIDNISELLEIV